MGIEVSTLSRPHNITTDYAFNVTLDNPSPGVKFVKAEGKENSVMCSIIIPANRRQSWGAHLWTRINNKEYLVQFFEEWLDQVISAFYCNGSPAEQAAATVLDWFFSHFLHLLEGAVRYC